MYGSNQFGLGRIDHRLLAPEQLERLKRRAMDQARQERSEAMRALFGWLLAGSRRIARQVWNGYRERRERRQTVAVLHALDDHQLKDIGLRRSEIESVVSGYDRDPTRRPRGARYHGLNHPGTFKEAA